MPSPARSFRAWRGEAVGVLGSDRAVARMVWAERAERLAAIRDEAARQLAGRD